ncbi:MAG TPA: hypothetical protein VIT67_07475 [Povalibacter sp.]|jgi:hypothetical protein
MTEHRESEPFYARKLYRLLASGFGLFLMGGGFYVLFFSGTTTIPRLVAGSVLVLFGYNMVASAYNAKESWLSRLGPLP